MADTARQFVVQKRFRECIAQIAYIILSAELEVLFANFGRDESADFPPSTFELTMMLDGKEVSYRKENNTTANDGP